MRDEIRMNRRSAMAGAGASGVSLLLGATMTKAKTGKSRDSTWPQIPPLLDHLV